MYKHNNNNIWILGRFTQMHMNNEAKKCNDKNPENNNGWRRTKDKLGWKEGRENGEEMTKTEGGQDKEIQKKAKHTEHFRGKWLKTDWQEKMDDDDAFEKDLHPIQFLFCFSSCDFFHPSYISLNCLPVSSFVCMNWQNACLCRCSDVNDDYSVILSTIVSLLFCSIQL